MSHNFVERFMKAKGLSVETPSKCSDCRGCQECSFREQQYKEKETMDYRAIEPGIRLENEDELVTEDDAKKAVEQTEEVANESPIATFQSKADVMCHGYKGEEVNVEVQYAGQDDPAKLQQPGTRRQDC